MKKNTIAKPRVRDDVPWPPVDLGSRLRHLRMNTANEHDGALTQKEVSASLSSMLNYSVPYRKYSEWETNTKEPSLTEIACLAKLYNTTCDYLLTGTQAEHVDASRKYGLSNEALRVLDYLNHRLLIHVEPLLTDRILQKIRKTDSEKTIFTVIHLLSFINAFLASPLLIDIASSFTKHVYNTEYIPSVYKSIEAEIPEMSQDNMMFEHWKVRNVIDKIYTDYPRFGNYSFEKKDPEERLKTDEYHLSKKWAQLFKSLLKNTNIIKNGILYTDKKTVFENRSLSDEELAQLRSLSKEKEAQHEEGK